MATVATEPLRYGEARARWVLLATVLGSGMAFLDATVVNVALPAIGRDLDTGIAGLQWTVNAYTLTLAAFILLGGAAGDRLGRRRVFLVGAVGFALASLLCGLAPNIETLVAARTLQGIGGALLTPGSLAILQSTFAEEDRGKAIGTWSGLGGLAAAVGPFLGGWLVDAASWRWVFLINLPLALLVVLVTLRHVPESRDEEAQHGDGVDVAGAAWGVVALSGLTLGLVSWGERGIGSAQTWLALLLGAAGGVAFVRAEQRARHPMLPLAIFSARLFTVVNVVTFAVYAALSGVFFMLVLTLQVVSGFSPLLAGAALLPVTVVMLVLSARSGDLSQRIGPRPQMTLGPLLSAAGILLLVRIDADATYVGEVLPGVLLFGLGLAATVAPLTTTVLAAAPLRHAGVASGVNNAVARTAGLLMVAALPLLAQLPADGYEDPAALSATFDRAMVLCAALLAVGGLVSATMIRSPAADAAPSGDARLDAQPAAPSPPDVHADHAQHAVHRGHAQHRGQGEHHDVECPCRYYCAVGGPPLQHVGEE